MAEIVEVEVTLTGPATVASVVIEDSPGADGADGADGAPGADGVGIPAGGTTGQVLEKSSDNDYETVWATPSGGSGSGDVVGPSSSVTTRIATFNGTTGKLIADGGSTIANVLDRTNHTGTQAISTVTSLQASLDAKAASSHTHAISDTTGLQAALDAKAASSHTHAAGDITGLATSATTDTTSATNITSGTLPIARIADGAVTLAKMADVAASKLIGRYTGSTGVPETITVGTDFSLSGGTLSLVVDPTNASLLSSGTLPDGRFPATLPAASGANLTALNATNLASGTVADARLSSNVPLEDAACTFSVNGAASTPAVRISGSIFTGGTGTTTTPQFLIAPSGVTMPTTWSTSGTPLGIVTATGFAGNFIHCSVNGAAAVFTVSSGGIVTAARLVDGGGTMGIWGSLVSIGTGCMFGFSSTTGYTGSVDVAIKRNAAGVVEVNSGTAGTFRDIKARAFIADERIRHKPYTVAGLSGISSPVAGDEVCVTDATAPTYLGALTGGGGVFCKALYNGSAWVSC